MAVPAEPTSHVVAVRRREPRHDVLGERWGAAGVSVGAWGSSRALALAEGANWERGGKLCALTLMVPARMWP